MAHISLALLFIGLIVGYILLCPRWNYSFYRPLLFHPVRFSDETLFVAPLIAGVQGENVSFKNTQGETLYAWYFNKLGAKYTVLVSHGNGGNISYRKDTITFLLNAGASAMIYDYRGYGKSEGLPTVGGVCDDARSAYDYLVKNRGVNPKQMILYGESLGCAISSHLSTERECAGIILQSGFLSLNRIAQEIFPLLAIYPGLLLASPLLDTHNIMKKAHSPLLILHGHKDAVVPYAHATTLYESAIEPKRFSNFPLAGHSDICTVSPNEYSNALSDFFLWVETHHGEKGTAFVAEVNTRQAS